MSSMPLPLSAHEKSCNIVGKKPNCATFAKPTVVDIVDDANNSADRPLLDGYNIKIDCMRVHYITIGQNTFGSYALIHAHE